MSTHAGVAVVERLRSLPTETEWLEFKRTRCEPELLGQYLSSIANSARLQGEARGYLLLDIDDVTHEVVGTDFDPYAAKAKGNQALLAWLGAGLRPDPDLDVTVVAHPRGQVVVFSVGAAKDQPIALLGSAFVCVGTSKTELSKYPETARKLWTLGSDWSAEVCSFLSTDPFNAATWMSCSCRSYRIGCPKRRSSISSKI